MVGAFDDTARYPISVELQSAISGESTGWSKKPHKVNDTIILQPYVIESCGFLQNVPKEISYVTKVSI